MESFLHLIQNPSVSDKTVRITFMLMIVKSKNRAIDYGVAINLLEEYRPEAAKHFAFEHVIPDQEIDDCMAEGTTRLHLDSLAEEPNHEEKMADALVLLQKHRPQILERLIAQASKQD